MNEIHGNINDFYCSCPIVNAVSSQIASIVRTQLGGVQYLLDLQMTNEVNRVVVRWKKVRILKTWRMNNE